MGAEEWIVVVLVVGTRLLLPFAIPYWPLPAAIACMLVDSIDQTIFQQFPDIPLEGYQSYDKSLDIYYLEYFWDFVEAVRMRWNTMRMGKWTVILSIAAIWIFIKLPQEWWIHIAKLDMTDAIKESLFGVEATDS